jgi:1-acyl-sn-glycerol-3-phosphate acyltransferase
LQPFYLRLTRPVFEAFARLVFRFYCPLTVEGRENLPPMPFLFCSNHSSHMDSIVLMTASRRGFSRFGLLAASDYFFRSPAVYRGFSCLVNLIPISRNPTPSSLNGTIEECRRFLNGGTRSLILFPEGTRSMDGEIAPFKRGAGMLAVHLGLPLVPAYIEGTRHAMPKGRFLPVPGPVTIRIGSPIHPDAVASGANGRGYEFIVAEAKKRIDALKGSTRAE